jgi:hypothetical protein
LIGLTPGEHDLSLKKHGYETVNRRIFVSPEETVSVFVELDPDDGFVTMTITSEPPGASVAVNGLDSGQRTPLEDYVLKVGQRYEVRISLPGHVPFVKSVRPKEGEPVRIAAELSRGGFVSLQSNVKARAYIPGLLDQELPVVRHILPVGTHAIQIRNEALGIEQVVKVQIAPGERTARKIRFGFVETAAEEQKLLGSDGQKVSKLVLPVGRRRVTILGTKDGEKQVRTVVVRPGQTSKVK